ncbi:MAG: sugar transferase [Neomegalonema sp.]|nr:sugar transferase [Neomegalonema sp.]
MEKTAVELAAKTTESGSMFTGVSTFDFVIALLVILFAGVFVYHQVVYPILLKIFAAAQRRRTPAAPLALPPRDELPAAAVIVPAHNEEAFIAAKLENLAALDYPRDRLQITVALDGCTDKTEEIARAKLEEFGNPSWLTLVINPTNIGKLATLNEQIEKCDAEFVALSDTSAIVDPDALLRAAAHFADAEVGVVVGSYRLREAGNAGEAIFRDSQSQVKADEATLASPMGASGAFYLFRRRFWQPLPPKTINDDFMLPMGIVGRGARGVYDPKIVALELEKTAPGQEFWRRVRIGAGNMQQFVKLPELRDFRKGWLAWLFWSGKGLRPLAIFALFLAALGAAYLAIKGYWLFQLGFAAFLAGAATALVVVFKPEWKVPTPVAWLGYMVEGATASFIGAVRYLFLGRAPKWSATTRESIAAEGEVIVWQQGVDGETVIQFGAAAEKDTAALHAVFAATGGEDQDPGGYIPWTVSLSKRIVDIVLALIGLIGLAILFPFLALFIKLTSPGPIIYSQMKVGRARRDRTDIFWMHKFRTMYVDADKRASIPSLKGDPRVTPAGRFLRPTRLDELPQFINILKGDMSFIGPRPERPSWTKDIEDKVPFFIERTHGLRPGLTGLAQVNQSHDQAVTEPEMKAAYDHAYAARLSSWWSWLWTDLVILFKTAATIVGAKG